MHCRTVWALLCGRFKTSAGLLLILLNVVQSQTVHKTVKVLEGNSTSILCELNSCCRPEHCVDWSYNIFDGRDFQYGGCSRDCGSCHTDCPHTQSDEPCREIYFEEARRSCAGVYQCQDCGTTEQPAYRIKLDVHYPPSKLNISNSHPIAIQGQPFELSCQMSDLGNPEAEIAWQPDTDGVITQGHGSSTIRFERVDHQTMPREIKCYPTQDGSRVSKDVLQNLGDSATLEIHFHMTAPDRTTSSTATIPHVSSAKTTEMAPIVAAGMETDTSPKVQNHEIFTMAVIMSCAFGGVMSLCVISAWVYNKRKASPRTSQLQLQETGTSLSGEDNAPRQETSLPILLPEYSLQTIDTGFTSDTDPTPSAVGVPVQVSSIHPYLQEPNFNPRVPIMVSLKTTTPQQRVGRLENTALTNGEGTPTSPKVAAADNTPDRILHLNEETSPNNERKQTSPKLPAANMNTPDRILCLNKETSPKDRPRATKRSECKSAFSSTSTERATRPKSVTNGRQREDVRRSVSLDESTPSEPHTLCSSLPDSGSCPELDEMISGKSTVKTEPEILRETPKEGGCEEKRSPSKCKEKTGPKAGLVGSMETIVEDTAHIVKKKPPAGNQSGKESLDVEALSLGGNKVATTIVQMIRKQLVVRGHLDLPYLTFSDLCLRLYNTGSNWKVLAGKLGLTVEDVELIDSCSAQHGLLAGEIVIRHWQRTADQDGTAPCNLRNLRGILTDMGRRDLVDMLKN